MLAYRMMRTCKATPMHVVRAASPSTHVTRAAASNGRPICSQVVKIESSDSVGILAVYHM